MSTSPLVMPREERLRVLMLATFFPKPGNRLMGTWALAPAQALLRNDVDITVVSPTGWVPRHLNRVPGLERLGSWADSPQAFDWDGLRAEYPRWLWYAHRTGGLGAWARRRPLPQLTLGWRSIRAALERAVREHQPDVIYAHHASISGYLALQVHRATGVPYVVIEHDHGEIADCARYPARFALYDEVIGSAAGVVTVATPMRDALTSLFPRARAHVVHNAAELPEPALSDVPRPRELDGRVVVLTAAHLYERKAVPLLVDAFARIADRHPTAVLRIAGDGEDREAVERAVGAAGLGDRIHVLGRTPHAQVIQEMAWADVFALVGWDEPHAIAHMEAMAAGLPVVCADDGGIMDIFADGVHGYAVPPRNVDATAQALDRLLGDEPGRKRMGAHARALVAESHTWDEHARCLIEVFREAVASSSVRAAAGAPIR